MFDHAYELLTCMWNMLAEGGGLTKSLGEYINEKICWGVNMKGNKQGGGEHARFFVSVSIFESIKHARYCKCIAKIYFRRNE